MKYDHLFEVGQYNTDFNEILGLNEKALPIMESSGFITHLAKKHHYSALKYLPKLSYILDNPDYIGVNPNEKDISYEIVKCFEDNIMVGVKIQRDKNYFYVATMHRISKKALSNYIKNGRLQRYIDKSQKEE